MLSIALDAEADALYIGLRRGKVARTEDLDDLTMVDVDSQGAVLGIEVIHPARAWPLRLFFDRYQVDQRTRAALEQTYPHLLAGVLPRSYNADELSANRATTTAVAVAL